jgi:sugar phosphate isomerase/epimerase
MVKLYFKPIALNQNTCDNLSLLEFIQFAKNANFDGVELNYKKIKESLESDSRLSLNNILEIMGSYHLKTMSIFSLNDFSLCSDTNYKVNVLKNLNLLIEYCRKLESELIIVRSSTLKDFEGIVNVPKWRIINKTRKRLEDIAKSASKEDINIGFDFLFQNSSIPDLEHAKEIIKPLESLENIGYIIDIFHLVRNKIDFNQLIDIKKLIFLIRIADFRNIENEILKRLFPGKGNFDFLNFYTFIQKIRYNNIFSIKLSKQECSEDLYEKFYTIFKSK